MTKQKPTERVVLAAIGGLVILEVVAMLKGINGKLFSLIVFLIGGLAGLVMPQFPRR